MTVDSDLTPDPSLNAARIVNLATASHILPAEIEAAWLKWSAGVENVDERGMTILRAAFEAGWVSSRSDS